MIAIYLQNIDQAGEVRQLLLAKKSHQVYLDASGKDPTQVTEEALKLNRLLQDVPGLIKPIVVGPLHSLTKIMDRRFANFNIRTTGFTYEEYVKNVSLI